MSTVADDVQVDGGKARTRAPWTMPTEVEYYSTMMNSIRGKKYELYAVSRILHLAEETDIEFIAQQPIRLDGGRLALLDLYLPQFNIGVEVNELHHLHPGTREYDRARERKILDRAAVVLHQVEVAEDAALGTLKGQVDALIEKIRQWRADAIAAGTFTPFHYGNRYLPSYWRSVGRVTTVDDMQMPRTIHVCALFGRSRRQYMHAVLPLHDGLRVWMPKLHQEGVKKADKEWRNTLSADGLTIVEEQVKSGTYFYHPGDQSIVFALFKEPVTREEYYRFLGVFEVVDVQEIDDVEQKKRVTYQRVSDEIDLTAYPDPPQYP